METEGAGERKERKDRREESERKRGEEAQASLLCFFTQRR